MQEALSHSRRLEKSREGYLGPFHHVMGADYGEMREIMVEPNAVRDDRALIIAKVIYRSQQFDPIRPPGLNARKHLICLSARLLDAFPLRRRTRRQRRMWKRPLQQPWQIDRTVGVNLCAYQQNVPTTGTEFRHRPIQRVLQLRV